MQDRGSLNLFACRHRPASVGSYLDRLRSAGGKPPSHERENGYPHSHMLTEAIGVCKRGFQIGSRFNNIAQALASITSSAEPLDIINYCLWFVGPAQMWTTLTKVGRSINGPCDTARNPDLKGGMVLTHPGS